MQLYCGRSVKMSMADHVSGSCSLNSKRNMCLNCPADGEVASTVLKTELGIIRCVSAN